MILAPELFHLLAEGIIGIHDEPAVTALLDDRGAGDIGGHVRVVAEMYRIWRTCLARQLRGRDVAGHHHLVAFPRELGERECDAGALHVGDNVHALVEPLSGNAHAEVRLVLMVGCQNLDVEAILPRELRHSLLDADDGARAAHITIHT
jgi:hypothetical protein